MMYYFMFQKNVSMTFFDDHYTWNIFFTRGLMCFTRWSAFLTHAHCGKPIFWLVKFFKNQNMLLRSHQTFFCKFHTVGTFQPLRNGWYTFADTWITDLLPFWVVPKQIFLLNWNSFCYKSIPNNEVYIYKKRKTNILLFLKKIPLIH